MRSLPVVESIAGLNTVTSTPDSDDVGWLAGARRIPSPNQDARPPNCVIDTLIIHHISLPPGYFRGDAIERLFTNRFDASGNGDHPTNRFESPGNSDYVALIGLRVSAHFLVRRHGGLVQFVATGRRAWHAGVSRLLERERCNDFSIGIELEGDGARAFTASQYRRLEGLIVHLAARHPLRWIAGHSDIAPGRKSDPGPSFSWARLVPVMARAGLVRPFEDDTPPTT